MRGLLWTIGFLLIGLLSGCSWRSYRGQVLAPTALAAHRTVAILPFDVEFTGLRDLVRPLGPWTDSAVRRPLSLQPTRPSPERERLGHQFQAALHAAFVRQQAQHPSAVAYQLPADTNQRLARAGITDANLTSRPMAELRAALGVDAVLVGRCYVRQLLPGGVSVAILLLSNANPMADNGVHTYLDLYDAKSGQLAWHFDHELRGRPNTSPAALAQALVRNMRRVPPYQQ